jgi:hypothetical protein
VKKLAIAVVFVVLGCSRQVKVSSTPTSSTSATSTGVGASTAREAVQTFMATAKAQDIQAMANIWGTSAGPASSTMGSDQLEPRLIYIMRCLRHDSYTILSESLAAGGERVYSLEVRRGTLTPKANFTTTLGPQNRWYLREFQLENLNPICTAK